MQPIYNLIGKIVSELNTPQQYGAIADGVSNCSPAIKELITNNAGGTIYFPAGTYAIMEPIVTDSHVDNNVNMIFDPSAKIVPLKAMDYLLDYGGTVTNTQILKTRKVFICGATFDASDTKLNKAAVRIGSYVCNAVFCNCRILTKETDGLIVGETSHVVPTDAYIKDVLIRNSTSDNTNNGLVLNGTDNNIENARVYCYNTNILCNAPTQFFNKIHTLANDNGNDQVSMYLKSGVQAVLSTYYADSEETFIKTEDNCFIIASNCYYYSYRDNLTTMFNVGSGTSIKLSGLYVRCKAGTNEHIGIIVPYNDLKIVADKSMYNVTGLVINGLQYMRPGDILKGMLSSDNSLTFADTTLALNTWYHVGTMAMDENIWKQFEFVCSGMQTIIPLDIKCSNSGVLSANLGSGKIQTNDDATYKVGFSLHNTGFDASIDYPRVDVYIQRTTGSTRVLEYFKVLSKCNIPISTITCSSSSTLETASASPTITFSIDCTNKTIVQD